MQGAGGGGERAQAALLGDDRRIVPERRGLRTAVPPFPLRRSPTPT
jgi:hypothetical protein